MPDSLAELEQQRNTLFHEMLRLPHFRSGSLTATSGRCGKPSCRCPQPHQPGHSPSFRLTRTVQGKTVTESFASPSALQKAQREVEAYHRFRELAQALLEINEKICQARRSKPDLDL